MRSACGREKAMCARSLTDGTGRRPANEISISKRYIFGQNQLEIRRFFSIARLIKPGIDGTVE